MKKSTSKTTEYIKTIKNSPEKKRSYGFFGFSILVGIVLIVFAVRPTILTITRINKEIKEKTNVNRLLDNKIKALSSLDREYIENRDSFDNLELIYPVSGNFTLLTSNIDSIVGRNGFVLSSINFDKYSGDSFKASTRVLVPSTVRISVRGNESNLINLLKDLESLPMYPTADSVSYSVPRDRDSVTSFSISLRFYTVDNNNFYK